MNNYGDDPQDTPMDDVKSFLKIMCILLAATGVIGFFILAQGCAYVTDGGTVNQNIDASRAVAIEHGKEVL